MQEVCIYIILCLYHRTVVCNGIEMPMLNCVKMYNLYKYNIIKKLMRISFVYLFCFCAPGSHLISFNWQTVPYLIPGMSIIC